MMERKLLTTPDLLESPVVANCCMNRERELEGSNGYECELKLNVLEFLRARPSQTVAWLDVCCGTGRALSQAATKWRAVEPKQRQLRIMGLDLAGHFLQHQFSPSLELRKTALEDFVPEQRYDLVTCVHGLHYIGDKLHAISKMVKCLSEDGLFITNLDPNSFYFADGQSAGRTVLSRLKTLGFVWQGKHNLLQFQRGQAFEGIKLSYCGADDGAGPNYTGQPAVNSYYEREL